MSAFDKKQLDLPISCVDVVVMSVIDGRLQVLLSKRASAPFKGRWALPGAFLNPSVDADADSAAARVVRDKSGIPSATPWIEQLRTFSGKTRDPRGWSVTIGYFALVPGSSVEPPPSPKVGAPKWFPVDELPASMAFDHREICSAAAVRVRDKVGYSMLAVHLLPAEFTLSELQGVHEDILGSPLDKSAFRKRLSSVDCLEPADGRMRGGSNRPAKLWRLKKGSDLHVFRRSMA